MTVGFHTLRHHVMPLLDDTGLARALTEGRAVLEEVVGRTIDLFAYPHGRADARVAAATRAAGFAAAFTGVGDAMSQHRNRYLLSRWEPGAAPAEEMLAKAAYRLLRPAQGDR